MLKRNSHDLHFGIRNGKYLVKLYFNGNEIVMPQIRWGSYSVADPAIINDYPVQWVRSYPNYQSSLSTANRYVQWQIAASNQNYGPNQPYDHNQASGAWGGVDAMTLMNSPTELDALAAHYNMDGLSERKIATGVINGDNTFTTMLFAALAWQDNKTEISLKDSIDKSVDFFIRAQMPCGGYGEYYPKTDKVLENPDELSYLNAISIHGETIIEMLWKLRYIIDGKYPYNNDLVDATKIPALQSAHDKILDMLVNTQDTSSGRRTGWASYYDETSGRPVWGPHWVPNCVNVYETKRIIEYLWTLETKTEEQRIALSEAIEFIKEVKVVDTNYNRFQAPYFEPQVGTNMWHRFMKYHEGTWQAVYGLSNGVLSYSIDDVPAEDITKSWAFNGLCDHICELAPL